MGTLESLCPLGGVQEDGGGAVEEPEAGQGALPRPEVLGAVIHLHLYPVVPIHALPVATGDKELVTQRYHPAILMKCVQELHLREG